MTYALPAQIPYQRYQFTGFGAAPVPFNAAATWNDWLAGAPTPTSDGNIPAGMRAADAIRTALTQAGYGPFNMGVAWGTSADKAGMGKFVNDNQITPSPVASWWPTKQALIALESAPGVNTAGMSGAKIGLLIFGAVALAALAYRAKKKDTGSYSAYTSNRRRRRSYRANGDVRSVTSSELREGLVVRRKGSRRKEVVGPRSTDPRKHHMHLVYPMYGKYSRGRYLTRYTLLHNYYIDSSDK